MGSHPIHLAVRFFLELAALVAMGRWGYGLAEGSLRYLAMIAVPAIAAACWGTFATIGDPSRSGSAPIPIPGSTRLLLELAYFGFAVWAFRRTGDVVMSSAFAVAVVVHYALSYDRISWLLRH